MNEHFFFIFLIFIISQVHSKLPDEKRRELLSKYTKKVSLENFYNLENQFESFENLIMIQMQSKV